MELILTLVASAAIAVLTAYLTALNQREKLRHELDAQREKMREELKLQYSVETAIVHLLEHPSYQTRSFKKIKHHLRGMECVELRKALVRAGAVVVREKDGDEMWGLLRLNKDSVK